MRPRARSSTLPLLALLATLTLSLACSDSTAPLPRTDAGRPRRQIDPPTGVVRPLPPHAIKADGIGPYKIGASLKSILALQPHGPRVVLMEIDGLLDYSVVRAENDALVIGADRGVGPSSGIRFIAVLDPEMARTEAGKGVGSSRRDLEATAGEPLVSPRLLADPRMLMFAALPSARFILRGETVAAVLLRADPGLEAPDAVTPAAGAEVATAGSAGAAAGAGLVIDAGAGTAATPPCGAPLTVEPASVVEVARLRAADVVSLRWGCLSGSGAEAVLVAGEQLVVIASADARIAGGEARTSPDAKLRRVTSMEIPGLVFAGPLRSDDGRDDLAVVVQRESDQVRIVEVQLYRLDGGRLIRTSAQEVYRLTAHSAGWIGAALADVELLVELKAHADEIEVTGALVHLPAAGVAGARDIAPLLPVMVSRRRPRPAGTGAGSGSVAAPPLASDAGAGAHDAAPRPRDGASPVRSRDAAPARRRDGAP